MSDTICSAVRTAAAQDMNRSQRHWGVTEGSFRRSQTSGCCLYDNRVKKQSHGNEAQTSLRQRYIKETNVKNDPNQLNNLIKKNCDVVTWTPRPGATLDLGRMLKDPTDSKGIVEPPEGTKIYKDSWDFGPYLKTLHSAVGDEIFLHSSWIKEYFTWAGFKSYNLVVRMIETDEDFNPLPGGYDYLVDFLDLSFPKERPSREHPYEEIRSRVDVIRYVVRHGLLWDDLYIGFQTRLRRDPDIYHHLFWNHFQIKLPLTPPNWRSFLMHCG